MKILSRRDFLRAGGAAALGVTLGPTLFLAPRVALAGGRPESKTFVYLFQRGGCDGLSTVVPHFEKRYYDLRKATAIPVPVKGAANTALDLDGRFGLHPALAPLREWYEKKELAIVHAVGSPAGTRSHFDAQDYMETGTPGRKDTATGWITRFARANPQPDPSTFRTLSLTQTLPKCMSGDDDALAIAAFDRFRIGNDEDEGAGGAIGEMYRAKDETELHRAGQDAFDAVERLRKLDLGTMRPANGAKYPDSSLGRGLQSIAKLIRKDVGVQMAFVDCGGWDTHYAQGGVVGSLANGLRDLGNSVDAFRRDLGDAMGRVVLVTMTEFGRTAKENGTYGTDHGHASVSFVLGGDVKGGRVLGKWPGLDESALYQKRDLAVTTDFRDLLGEVATAHLGALRLDPVFPGHTPKPVGLYGAR